MIELTKDYIENLKSIIEAKDDAKAQEVLHELYPADIAELYQELNLQEAIYLYLLMDGDKAADVLMELDEEDRHKLLKELPNELIAKRFVDNMETDDAVDLMRELDEDTQEEILSHIEDVEQAGDIVDLLKYDEDTAGGLMGTEMIVVNENWSMPKCIDEMRKQAEEMSEIYYVYVVDDDERLKGVLPLQKLITHPSVSKIKHVMKKDPISVRDSDSIEEVTETIEKYDLVALPVVDSIGRLVGRITIDDVMDEVREQHERDYQLASGISQDVETSDNVFTQTAARLPWLLIGMIGGLGNSVILGGFESSFAADRWYRWKRRHTIFRYRGTGLGKQYLEGREYRTANPKRVRSLVNQCQHYQSGRVHLQLLHAGRPGDYGLRIFKPIRRRNVRQYIRHVSSHDLR